MALHTNKTMYLHRLGDLIRIQVFQNGKPDPHMLTIELTSGSISLSDSNKALNEELGSEKILGIFGLQKLVNGYALAVITGVKKVSLRDRELILEHTLRAVSSLGKSLFEDARPQLVTPCIRSLSFSKLHNLLCFEASYAIPYTSCWCI